MLILTRRDGEAINIGDSIRLVVSSVTDDKVRIGIDAPPSVLVLREELLCTHDGLDTEQSGKLASM